MGVETEGSAETEVAMEQYQTPLPSDYPHRTEDTQPDEAQQALPEDDEQVSTSASSKCILLSALAFLLAAVFASQRPWYTLLFAFLAVLPAVPIARFLLRSFRDPAVSRSFLLSQFLLGAVPLIILVALVELLLSALIAYAIFNSQIDEVQSALNGVDEAQTDSGDERTELLFQRLAKVIPMWKIVLYFVLIAFITAGAVEEIGKWLVARRYRKIEADDPDGTTRLGCRGVIISACASALGFAATENMFYVLGLSQGEDPVSFGVIGVILLRGLLAYPVHIGTQFYVALSAAQHHVFHDRSSVALALLIAVLFHGLFDAVAFFAMIFIGFEIVPKWVGTFVPIFDLSLIGLLMLLCRGRYKALLERERLVLFSNPA